MGMITRPIPEDIAEIRRWQWTARAHRILDGDWREDLIAHIQAQVGAIRQEAWGEPDMSRNVLQSICDTMSVAYVEAPTVTREDGQPGDLPALVSASGLWAYMAGTGQRDLWGLRELWIRLDVIDGAPVYRGVAPECLIAYPDPERPSRPLRVDELRLRDLGGELVWCWDVLDITDPSAPRYEVRRDDGGAPGEDVTAAALGMVPVGDAYPWRWADGSPYLPGVLYHARESGRLWDPWANRGMVSGTLEIATGYTMLSHIRRGAAWPQRYVANGYIAGTQDEGGTGTRRSAVVVDPAVIVHIAQTEGTEGQTVQIGQWEQGADPVAHMESLRSYEQSVATSAGVPVSDLQAMGGDARSGYAISLSREGKKEVQRIIEPQLRAGDLELIDKTAAALTAAGVGPYPVGGWSITYHQHPPSAAERQQDVTTGQAEVDAGLLSPVTLYQRLNPGASRADALRELTRAQTDRRLIDAGYIPGGDNG